MCFGFVIDLEHPAPCKSLSTRAKLMYILAWDDGSGRFQGAGCSKTLLRVIPMAKNDNIVLKHD